MTAIVTNHRVAAASGVAGAITRTYARLVAWGRREAAVGATLRELQALTDRELADIGMVRADLPRIAREAHA